MEKSPRQHGRRLGGKEPPPGGAVTTHGRWWYAESFEDPADRGRTHAVAEAEQFALDALVAPARIIAGHLLDQGGDGRVDRRPTGPAGICPVAGDQPPMPTQDRGRGDEPVRLQRRGRSLTRAARTARSAQSSRGFGFWRRRTAFS